MRLLARPGFPEINPDARVTFLSVTYRLLSHKLVYDKSAAPVA
jgi:hypothetical protein